jgi:hypothetical protein
LRQFTYEFILNFLVLLYHLYAGILNPLVLVYEMCGHLLSVHERTLFIYVYLIQIMLFIAEYPFSEFIVINLSNPSPHSKVISHLTTC